MASIITISKTFAWNVQQSLQISKTFTWEVGDGPLYWYKIVWKNPVCPPNECGDYESCEIVPTECDCSPVATQSDYIEVWHMQATSIAHLCERIQTELCYRRPLGKVFDKVYRYDRPVLCCDVDRFIQDGISITDTYIEVDPCDCACISYVDPCDCGDIHTPCDESLVPSAINLFSVPTPHLYLIDGFGTEEITIAQPQIDSIITKDGFIPSKLKINHNLKTPIKEIFYNKSSQSWQNTAHAKDRKFFMELSYKDSWKFQFREQEAKKASKLSVEFGNLNKSGFMMNVNANTKIFTVNSSVQSKFLQDDLNSWKKNPHLEVKISF